MKKLTEKLLDNLNSAVILINLNYEIVYANKKATKRFRIGKRKATRCYEIIHKQKEPCAFCPVKSLSSKNREISFCFSVKEKDFFEAELTYFDRKHRIILLKEVKAEKLPSDIVFYVVERIPAIVFFIKNGKITYVNRSVLRSLGYSPEELIGKNIVKLLVPPDERARIEKHLEKVLKKGEDESSIFILRNKKGQLRTFLCYCFPVKVSIDKEFLVVSGIDITEFMEIKAKLESVHKNRTFSEFLRGLVHDFNNVLQRLENHLKEIEKDIHNPENIQKNIELARKILFSWIDLNKLLLDYTREIKGVREKKTEMISFLKENLEFFQLIAGEKIHISLDFNYIAKVWIPGDTSFWRYIFLNFISNAKDAIRESGYITIKLGSVKEKDRKYLIISIRDTGCGIPEENIKKIFQPFFTTKEKGSGLGLFLIKSHIENLKGKIEVESKLGEGTTFKIYIPLIDIKYIGEEVQNNEIIIYLVEDEEDIKKALKKLLEKQNYKVYDFSSGKEVLERIKDLPSPQLLITDLNLMDIKGQELYSILKEKFPELEVIYLTGDIFALAEFPPERILLKPINFEDLLFKIKKLFI